MPANNYAEFYQQNRYFARKIIEQACGSASAIYLYDQNQAQAITILYQKGFSDQCIRRFSCGAYRYEPALAQLSTNEERITVSACVREESRHTNQRQRYWKLFGDDGFHETLTSVARISSNLSLVVGIALLERDLRHSCHLQSDKVLNTFDQWFDSAIDFLVEDSIRRSYSCLTLDAPKDTESLVENLTPRELQVLGLLRKGLLNKQISSLLSISQYTVDNHLRNIYRKLGVRRRIELISKLGGTP